MSSSVTRITGLASGLDTTSIVEGMLSRDQTKIDKQNQLITSLEWKAEAYRDINTKLRNFREEYMSVLSSSSNMLSTSMYNVNEVNMLSTTSAVTVTALTDAQTGSYSIDEITTLATSATMSSEAVFSGDSLSADTTLADLALTTALVFDSGSISFSINEVDFTFSEDDTIGDMMTQINSSSAGVKFSYSSLSKGFTLKATDTGSSSTVEVTNTTGNAFDATSSAFGISEGIETGQNATLVINGYAVEQETNTFTIDGVKYALKAESTEAIGFTIDKNVDAAVEKITDFIGAYNELVEELTDKITEDTHRAYEPLTDDERDQLTEEEIEDWEEMAKSGQLRSDSYITNMLATMRSAFYTSVAALEANGTNIGLSTTAYTDSGQITIDEEELRAALENNPDLVTSIFTATSSSDDPATEFQESGIITRISTAMLNYIDLTVDSSISSLETKIDDAEERLESLEDSYSNREESLWNKFSAMEAALATLNSQSDWLASLFSASMS